MIRGPDGHPPRSHSRLPTAEAVTTVDATIQTIEMMAMRSTRRFWNEVAAVTGRGVVRLARRAMAAVQVLGHHPPTR